MLLGWCHADMNQAMCWPMIGPCVIHLWALWVPKNSKFSCDMSTSQWVINDVIYDQWFVATCMGGGERKLYLILCFSIGFFVNGSILVLSKIHQKVTGFHVREIQAYAFYCGVLLVDGPDSENWWILGTGSFLKLSFWWVKRFQGHGASRISNFIGQTFTTSIFYPKGHSHTSLYHWKDLPEHFLIEWVWCGLWSHILPYKWI